MSLHVSNAVFWDDRNGELYRGDLIVSSGPDGCIKRTNESPAPGDEVLDANGKLAIEGLTCAHHHLYSALARGMPAPPRTPSNFAEILELVWWRLDKCLDLEMIRASATAAGLDALRCGVTRIVDHHASPFAVTGSLSALAEGLDNLGIAHALCYELSDRDGPDSAEQGLAETDSWLSAGNPGHVGLHASFTVSDTLLQRAVELAQKHNIGLHIHVAEDAVDQERCESEHGCRVVERLHQAGALDLPGTLLIHCLHLSENERRLIAESNAWVVQNVESNQNNAVGDFQDEGLNPDRILIGTDGMHGDMLRSTQAAFFLGQTTGGLGLDTAWSRLRGNDRYLTEHAPTAARRNDLVLLDYPTPTPLTADNILGHAFYGLDARHVSTVITNGRVVLQDGEFLHIDEDKTLRHCREQARRLWDALERS
jgi:cytosine/adenosine deaminase-related metal-dependent hydrolase